MNITTIYVLRDPRTKEIRYVGKTIQGLKKRLAAHLVRSKKKRTHRDCWIASLLAVGFVPEIEAIATASHDWPEEERRWIAHFRSIGCVLTNQSDGGEGTPGITLSESWRRKRSHLQTQLMTREHREHLSHRVKLSWTEERRSEKRLEMQSRWTAEKRQAASILANSGSVLAANRAAQKAYWTEEKRAKRSDEMRQRMTPEIKAELSRKWTPEMRAAQSERTRLQHLQRKQKEKNELAIPRATSI